MLSNHFVVFLLFILTIFADQKVGIIVDNFNSRNWNKIYKQFSSEMKNGITEEQFKTTMETVRDKLGIMQDYMTIDVGRMFFICERNLDTGVVNYQVNDNEEFITFQLKYTPKSMFTFLHENKNNSKVSLSFSTVKHNYSLNANQNLAICSVFKITLVVEYARQVTIGKINPLLCVDLSQVNKYFMPHVDTGHVSWLNTIKKTCASHQQIIVGMIEYSSNAITQYLTDILTLQKVNQLIISLNLTHTQPIHIVSSMFAMNNTYNLPRQQYLNMLRLMTFSEVKNISNTIHQKLKNGTLNLSKDQFYLDPDVINIHIKLIAKSNAASYLKFMQIINQNQFFDNNTLYTIKLLFDQVLLVTDFDRSTFIHAGAKRGSSNFINMTYAALAISGYAQFTQTIKVSYALIINEFNSAIISQRMLDLDTFILAIQTSQFYVQQFIKRMNQPNKIKRQKYLRELTL